MDLEYKARILADLKNKHGNDLRGKFIRDSHTPIASNITFSKNLLESQLRVNYVNEFDRLKGHYYANPNLPAPTKDHIKERLNNLQKLARKSLYGKDEYLYNDNVDEYDSKKSKLNKLCLLYFKSSYDDKWIKT